MQGELASCVEERKPTASQDAHARASQITGRRYHTHSATTRLGTTTVLPVGGQSAAMVKECAPRHRHRRCSRRAYQKRARGLVAASQSTRAQANYASMAAGSSRRAITRITGLTARSALGRVRR
jgi:hypothetical protein